MQSLNSFILSSNEKINPIFDTENTHTIVFSMDNNYVKYFAVALQSLIENSEQNINYDIIILETDIANYNKKILLKMIPQNFSLRFFKIDDFIIDKIDGNTLIAKSYWSIATWYRCFCPFIMLDYKKVLYCDSDIIFNKPIEKLFNIDFENKEILAVKDSCALRIEKDPKREEFLQEALNMKDTNTYFNAGIIMFNIPQININEYYNVLCKYIKLPHLPYLDQDVLNAVFYEKKKLISLKYNFSYHILISFKRTLDLYPEDFHDSRENPIIIHYTDKIKPWHNPKNEFCIEWWQYARKTPFYEDILYSNLKIVRNTTPKGRFYSSFFEYIFSVKNAWDNKHKVLTILGIKIKIKKKK
ncbi:MAG: glycosyltransferase family 8 protein [Candidatus Gastranaerophilales bacterium]|nr:glycosyltransferase family 8 protein [Candidatus Gastranaerophilales bacterium]